LEETAKLAAVVLLARRLKAANPDAKHPGKARIISWGKLAFPMEIIPRLSMGQKPALFRITPATGGICLTFPNKFFA
jgi:hypothetical protein